jgi:RHS repeat-associated protein
LGSTIATADDGATALSRSYDYDPDGNATDSGTGTDAIVRFAGGYPIGGLYHYGARYYDPATAAWTQQDPLNQISSLTQSNHYAYAGGDPVNSVDPSGEDLRKFAACLGVGLAMACGDGDESYRANPLESPIGQEVGEAAKKGGEVIEDVAEDGEEVAENIAEDLPGL